MIIKYFEPINVNKKLLIADRDGTLNIDTGYPHKIEDLTLLDYVIDNLKKYGTLFNLAIVTNQSGIGRGYFDISDTLDFNYELVRKLKNIGIKTTLVIICPHKPNDNCRCRKPNPLMIEKTIQIHKISNKNCFMIGDKDSDEKAAISANVKYEYASPKMETFIKWVNE